METKWLEDFISLVETNNFSRSAALRHVTQPAFSRRIQSLENWLGTDLVDRTSYPTRLTQAGIVFYEQALEMLAQINGARDMLRSKRAAAQTSIDLAVPHTLSLTFVPKWLTALERDFAPISSRLMALNVHDAVMQLVEGGCDLLLCYHHPRQPVQLDPGRYDMLVLGRESLRAYARCGKNKVPEFTLPGTAKHPLPFLSYTNNAYLGRMVELMLGDAKHPLHLDPHYETEMAEGLKMMALEGRGIAFLPESASRASSNKSCWRAPTAAHRNGKSKWKSGSIANGRRQRGAEKPSSSGCGTISNNRNNAPAASAAHRFRNADFCHSCMPSF